MIAAMVPGVALNVINFHGLAALFPWFAMGRDTVTVFTHVVFSITAALAYRKLRPSAQPSHWRLSCTSIGEPLTQPVH